MVPVSEFKRLALPFREAIPLDDNMVEPQTSAFWQTALKSGLVSKQILETCFGAIPEDKRSADAIDRRLARNVVNAGHLTLWQAQQLLSGRHTGLRIDRYELRDLLGQGGMGRVYLGYDTKLDRQVAIKVLSRERMNNPRALARFRREARVGAQLQHENLIRVYDEGDANAVPYLVMEYINGQTVGQLIAEQGRIPYPMAANLTRQVALGLAHLYQKGLLHRDVNPMNILVDRNGTAKLTDLGLAIDLEDLDDVVTRDGATVGTFDYISPEQARHSRHIDTRSDIYSLGCTFYHMISGRVPFPAPSLPEKLFAHQSNDPQPLSQVVEGVPGELDGVLRRMMSKKVEDRFENPSLLAKALEPFAMGQVERAVPTPARQALVGAAVASESPTVVEHGPASVSKTDASDPELIAQEGASNGKNTPTEAAISANSSGNDPFKLDLGPSPRLSDSLSGDDDTEAVERRSAGPWIGIGALAVLAVVGSIGAYMLGFVSPPQNNGTPDESKGTGLVAGQAAAEAPKADITVEYSDGTVFDAATLPDAIDMASGKPAEVVLRNKEAIHLEVEKPHQVSGSLKIRAEKGVAPVIGVAFRKSATWLRVSANAKVTVSGLTFEVVRLDQGPGNPPTLIEAGGNVEFDHCAFEADRGSQVIRVLKAEGRHTKLTGCWFEGFDQPVEQSLFPGADVTVSQSIFVRSPEGDNASGWPLSVRAMGVSREGVPKVAIDHVTAWGAGLLRAEGFSANLPLQVEIADTVVSTHTLLMWGGAFPDGLSWKGSNNLYEISGAAWVVRPPNGFNAVENSPSSLDSWTEKSNSVEEEEARVMDVRFADEAPAEIHKPSDFVLMNVDEPKPGAAPNQVGPEKVEKVEKAEKGEKEEKKKAS